MAYAMQDYCKMENKWNANEADHYRQLVQPKSGLAKSDIFLRKEMGHAKWREIIDNSKKFLERRRRLKKRAIKNIGST